MLNKIIYDDNQNRINSRGKRLIVLSGILNSCWSIFVIIVASRLVSIQDVGLLTIGFALAKLLVNIGKYGMRTCQVTDREDVYFSEWFVSRIITSVSMLVASGIVVYVRLVSGAYSKYKAGVVFLICMVFLVESFEDVITGYMQRNDRLDLSAIFQIIRSSIVVIINLVWMLLFKDIIFATLLSFVVSVIITFALSKKMLPVFNIREEKPRPKEIKRLLINSFPLFLMSFLVIYLSNAVKYEIDKSFDAISQAYYGYVSMPIFAITLVGGMIYQPVLTTLSMSWKINDVNKFRVLVRKQLILISGISALCLLAGYLLGIPVLSIIYNVTDLNGYKIILILLIICGIGESIINFMTSILVIFDLQNFSLLLHSVAGIVVYLTIGFVSKTYGIEGATRLVNIVIWLIAAMLIVAYAIVIKRKKEGSYREENRSIDNN